MFYIKQWVYLHGFLCCLVLGWLIEVLWDERLILKNLRFLWATLLIIVVSSLLNLYLPETKLFQGQIHIGGLLGMMVSKQLVLFFNFYGVAVILWTAALVLLVFYTEKSIKELFYLPIDIVRNLKNMYTDTYLHEYLIKSITAVKQKTANLFSFRLALPSSSSLLLRTSNKIENKTFFKIKNSDNTEEQIKPSEQCENSEEYTEFPLTLEGNDSDKYNFDEVEEKTEKKGLFGLKKPKKRKVQLKAKVVRHVENWELPRISLLEDPPLESKKIDEKEIRIKANLLTDKLAQFNVGGKIVGIKPGPAVTMFEFKPNIDVKISKITDLADDLSLALSSESVRIIAPIPGRDVVGIETSNAHQETVYLKDIIAEEEFWSEDIKLPIPLGRAANGDPKVVDLRKMPHLLVAGTTGSGKSVFIVSILTSFLFKHSPKTLRLILVDPKQVDLAVFNNVPHLLMPPVCEPKKAVVALRWTIREMEKRYRSMAKFGARGLEGFNEKVSLFTKEQILQHVKINEELEENNKKTKLIIIPNNLTLF